MNRAISNRFSVFSQELQHSLNPSTLLLSILSGLVAGVLTLTFMFSYSAVIFSGNLSPYIPRATGHMLFGAIVISVVVALFSQFRGVVAVPQDNPTAVMSIMIAAISENMGSSASPETLFLQASVIIALSTMAAGLLFFVIGHWQLSTLVQYIPYPVVAGFLGGTGWLLFKSSFSVMAGVAFNLGELSALADVAILWLPGAVFAVIVFMVSQRFTHFLIMPGLILGGISLFHIVLLTSGTSITAAIRQGWLMAPFGGGGLWRPLGLDAFRSIEWSMIVGEISGVGTILMIATISVLLNLTALESTYGHEIDVDKEMRMVGAANMVAALGGGLIGYHYISLSTLGHRMKGDSRLVGIVVALICILALTAGAELLSYFPKLILGGLVMFIGIGFLNDWVVRSWSKLSRSDMVVISVILVVIEMLGLLEGVAVGIGASAVLFILDYSRVHVVRHAFTGKELQSNVDRPAAHRVVLSKEGEQVLLLKLQGFIFFSTTIGLVQKIEEALEGSEKNLSFILLDFQYVTGIDTSALHGFVKIKQKALEKGVQLALVHVSSEIDRLFKTESFVDGNAVIDRMFEDSDHALEWCENFLLRTAGYDPDQEVLPISEQLREIFEDDHEREVFASYLSPVDFYQGDLLYQDDNSERQIYFVESGKLTLYMEKSEKNNFRFRRVGAGSLLGFSRFFRHRDENTPLSFQVDKATRAYALSINSFETMKKEDMAVAMKFQNFVLDHLSTLFVNNLEILRVLHRVEG